MNHRNPSLIIKFSTDGSHDFELFQNAMKHEEEKVKFEGGRRESIYIQMDLSLTIR